MSRPAQSYQNHRRYHVLFHFSVFPVLLLNLVWTLVKFVRFPALESGWTVIVAAALLVAASLPRIYGLRVQDRVIRLEERLRLKELAPEELRNRIPQLNRRQLVALRFASDAEVGELTRRVLDGELKTDDEIKQAIREWRPDLLRV